MSSLIGTRIGHFRVVELLGKGGMGEVYAGYDEKLDRRVALKCLPVEHSPDAESKLRFLREARTLSQLAHPNICQIFDYIEGDEADTLVLELIPGETLGSVLKKKLDSKAQLEIAEQIASVLVAAHEKGIIHRDLKPDNVMLTQGNQVKVLDFGLSRWQRDDETIAAIFVRDEAPQQRLRILDDERTAVVGERRPASSAASSNDSSSPITVIGTIVGTLRYMSPEQARGETATAASDLYSFGLLLQELFTGEPAYEKGVEAAEMLRMAKAGETRPVVEGIDPDLAALIARLKSPEPAARPSALDTAERLAFIRLKPQRQRKKMLVAAAMALLALFGAAMTVQTVRATRAERAAKREAETSREVSEFLVGLFKISDPSEAKGSTVTARELLDKGALRIEKELMGQPEVQATMMDTMGVVYRKLGLYKEARPLAETALATREKTLSGDHPDVATSLASVAELDAIQGKFKEAEQLSIRSLKLREKVLGLNHKDVAASLNSLGSLYRKQGKYAEALPLYLKSQRMQERILGPDDPEVASGLNKIANLYADQGRYADAEAAYRRSLKIREKVLGPDHPDVARSLNNLASLHVNQGRSVEAEPLLKRSLEIWEKTLGPEHTDVAGSLNNLASVYSDEGKFAEAEPLYLRSLRIREKALGPQHPDVAVSLNNLADLYRVSGKLAESEALYRRSLGIAEKALGPLHPDVGEILNGLGELKCLQKRYGEAETLFQRSLGIREKALGADHPFVAKSLYNLAGVSARRGRRVEALAFLGRALLGGGDSPWMRSVAKNPDLTSLHGDPEFDRIVAEVGRRAEAKPKSS